MVVNFGANPNSLQQQQQQQRHHHHHHHADNGTSFENGGTSIWWNRLLHLRSKRGKVPKMVDFFSGDLEDWWSWKIRTETTFHKHGYHLLLDDVNSAVRHAQLDNIIFWQFVNATKYGLAYPLVHNDDPTKQSGHLAWQNLCQFYDGFSATPYSCSTRRIHLDDDDHVDSIAFLEDRDDDDSSNNKNHNNSQNNTADDEEQIHKFFNGGKYDTDNMDPTCKMGCTGCLALDQPLLQVSFDEIRDVAGHALYVFVDNVLSDRSSKYASTAITDIATDNKYASTAFQAEEL